MDKSQIDMDKRGNNNGYRFATVKSVSIRKRSTNEATAVISYNRRSAGTVQTRILQMVPAQLTKLCMGSNESRAPHASDRDAEPLLRKEEAHTPARMVLYLARPIIARHYN